MQLYDELIRALRTDVPLRMDVFGTLLTGECLVAVLLDCAMIGWSPFTSLCCPRPRRSVLELKCSVRLDKSSVLYQPSGIFRSLKFY